MINERFYYLLHQPRDAQGHRLWNITRLSREAMSRPSHVSQVLNNKPGRGHLTRRKLVAVFKTHFQNWPDLLAALGWNENGTLVPQGTFHVEKSNAT